MNILILFNYYIDPERGGTERVYSNLSPFFRKQGLGVYAYYFIQSSFDNKHCYNDIFRGTDKNSTSKTYKELKLLVNKWSIQCIICSSPSPVLMKVAEKLSGVMVYHHVHNVPSVLFDNDRLRFFERLNIDNWVTVKLSHLYMKIKYSPIFNMVKKNKHKVILLSDSFRSDFKSMFRFPDNLISAIANPFHIDELFDGVNVERGKILLYVGRLSERQKNVSSLLRIWKVVQERLKDYKLVIVGDGPDRKKYEDMAETMNLSRINFVGFQVPSYWYKTSSTLLMTSRYEGFPMVLVEAMQYGCVPFAYNSYLSLSDIIDDGVNGFNITPFDEKEYVEKLLVFLQSPVDIQKKIRQASIEKVKQFDVNVVGEKWIDLFKQSV